MSDPETKDVQRHRIESVSLAPQCARQISHANPTYEPKNGRDDVGADLVDQNEVAEDQDHSEATHSSTFPSIEEDVVRHWHRVFFFLSIGGSRGP